MIQKDPDRSVTSSPVTSENWEAAIRRQLKTATLFDDAYAAVFFDGALDCAQLLVSKICGEEYTVESVEIQKVIPQFGIKSVRLDVYAQDTGGGRHIFEFQLVTYPYLPRRGRYYLSSNDMQMLNAGSSYDELQDVTVVFICKSDVMKSGKPMHVFAMKDEDGRELGDGHRMIFLNAAYPDDWELKDLMHDILCANPEDMVYDEFRNRSMLLKRKKEGEVMFNDELEKLVQERERIVAEKAAEEAAAEKDKAVAETAEKTRHEVHYSQLCRLFKKGKSTDFISEATDFAPETVNRMRGEFEATGTFHL